MDRRVSQAAANGERPRPFTAAGEEDDIPACQSCRKRKLKCSREMPSCSQCSRLACVCLYDHKKQRPGVKSGAVENLNRRLEILEKILLDSQGNQKPAPSPIDTQGCLYHASLLIANELKTIGSIAPRLDQVEQHGNAGLSKVNCQRPIQMRNGDFESRSSPQSNLLRKRKHEEEDNWKVFDNTEFPPLPSTHILDAIVDVYFVKIQPWIPFLHQPTFRARLEDPQERPKLTVLLHALASATIKHLKFLDFGLDQLQVDRQVRISRNAVTLHAMGSLSVENLQALIILSFDYMGDGQISKAWPIIGSLTRTVEYLRLTIEPDESQQQSLLQPLTLLEKPKHWTDVEVRRRVFWNIFLLDRFCSVTSGWSTSLTSDDVRRRLPCDGKMWFKGDPAVTPYFGIWDKSAAKIGNSIAYIPALYPSQNEQDHMTDSSPGGRSSSGDVDVSKIGAFAYRIESTESLSQVTSFFLQQQVNFQNRQEVGAWLTRFKELDLRLVHWKMFLPQKWKDSNISRDAAFVKMDPNLTLAHITHNTSMILLHQHIAYPPAEWNEIVKLPSSCSAETCQLAAVETASIAEKYLKHAEGIVNSQFAFCAFVAARVFLVHWRFYNTELSPEFSSLINSLQKMSERWNGYQNEYDLRSVGQLTLDMAAKYRLQLQELHTKCLNDATFCLDILSHSDATSGLNIGGLPDQSTPTQTISETLSPRPPRKNTGECATTGNNDDSQTYPLNPEAETSPPNISSNQKYGHNPYLANGQSTSSNASQLQPFYGPWGLDVNARGTPSNDMMRNGIASGRIGNMGNGGLVGSDNIEDELTAMSHSLLDQQYLDLDRVITLEGTDFDFDMNNWGSVS